MYKKSLFALTMLVMSGCHEENAKTCDFAPYCENGSRVYCADGVKMTETCPEGVSCTDGACLPPDSTKCDPTTFTSYCQDENTRLYCLDGKIARESCPCSQNACQKPKPDICGNGIVEPDEVCDDGKDNGTYGKCASDCKSISMCGDGIVDDAEVCDDGNENGKYGKCASDCKSVSKCGDGIVDDTEVCDDGNENGTYGKCDSDCKSISKCGDGIVDDAEVCDDGNENGTYGKCDSDCKSISKCGDGIVSTPFEICDDGANNGIYGKCRDDCQSISACGDGIIDDPEEFCDDGSENGKTGKCAERCKAMTGCGNGIIEDGETCDPPSTTYPPSCAQSCQSIPTLLPEWPSAPIQSTDAPDACSDHDLWAKYLTYRERFIGNAAKHIPGFISWGTNPGETLPASYRDPSVNCSTVWNMTDCKFDDLADAQGMYGYMDTSLWLGILVHWLATEYRTFSILGIDTTETRKYLYLAIQTFNRLDESAEALFDMPGKLDGFFVRSDIPQNFFLKDDNYRFERTDAPNKGYECAASTGTCAVHKNTSPVSLLKSGFFVSQDQITGLYEGFGMLAKYLPDDAEYNGVKLRHEARGIIHRLITMLRDNAWLIGIQTDSGWQQIPDDWGGHAQLFSGFFAEGANHISAPDFGIEDYHDDATKLVLTTFTTVVNFLWELWESQNNYNRNLILRTINFTELWDDATFNQKALESGREIWALTHALYFDRPLPDDYPLWRLHAILTSAPCSGECLGDDCQNPVAGWMGEHFFVSPNERAGSKYTTGEYNGLDYLLAFNTYLLAYFQKTGHAYTQILPENTNPGKLQDILNGQKTSTYSIQDNIQTSDMSQIYCGRPFADWLRDNALGIVDIYTNGMRWSCSFDKTCTLTNDSAPYSHKNSLILGTNHDDNITIPAGYHHCIAGLDGNDTITAASGMHIVEGGKGNDIIKTQGPHVFIYSGDGNDQITTGSGYHLIDAGDGDDNIQAGNGTNIIIAGPGNDIIQAGSGSNYIHGGDGNDIIEAKSGDNTVWGDAGDDKVHLGGGNNIIWPGNGRAFIKVGNGDNKITSSTPEDVYICFGTGNNTIWAGWTGHSHCSPVQNSKTTDSCISDLTETDCSEEAYQAWK